MIVSNIKVTENKSVCRLSANVKFEASDNRKSLEIWFDFPKELMTIVSGGGNPFLAVLLAPSMRLGEDLNIKGKVSRFLLESTESVMDIYHAWDKELRKIKINVDDCEDYKISPSANACFFSGGVDSFYTLLKNIEKHPDDNESISHLIFVHGFDIKLEDNDLFNKILLHIDKVGINFDKKVLVVKTNLRAEFNNLVKWKIYYGGALASVGLVFDKFFKKIYIASPDSYANLEMSGSSPVLDHLWSTETLHFVHDGAEARRAEKVIDKISRYPEALELLRVCWENPNQEYNCGICEKCIRTMVPLQISGVLDKCKFSKKEINLKKLRNLEIDKDSIHYYEECLAFFNHDAKSSKLRSALISCLARNGRYRKFSRFRNLLLNFDKKICNGIIKKTYRLLR